MKTKEMLISGIYANIDNGVFYDVSLFGIEDDSFILIGSYKIGVKSYSDLAEFCRSEYCKYFGCDMYNIISLECLKNETNLNQIS